jgi:Tfp pilus assembly protein PilF
MSFLSFLFGPSAKNLENKADALFAAGKWGHAKQVYTQALHKLGKKSAAPDEDTQRILGKIARAGEKLAREHQRQAQDYLEGGYIEQAREMLALALEITQDLQFKTELENHLALIAQREKQARSGRLQKSRRGHDHALYDEGAPLDRIPQDQTDQPWQIAPDEEFFALIQTLPDHVQGAYLAYGPDFKEGYIALNRGDFDAAAKGLVKALKTTGPNSYVPLELAVAYLNLNRSADARKLLENFLPHHPDTLPAYELLCDIYWEEKAYDKVDKLLASVPQDLVESVAVTLLNGENMYQAGSYEQARSYYQSVLATYGWNEAVARELAKTSETLGLPDDARRIYQQIMHRCVGCGQKADPQVRHKYAELSFASGRYGTDILEIYLALALELPENASRYYERVSRIYAAQGNLQESERFRAISNQVEKDRIKQGHSD